MTNDERRRSHWLASGATEDECRQWNAQMWAAERYVASLREGNERLRQQMLRGQLAREDEAFYATYGYRLVCGGQDPALWAAALSTTRRYG